jgi:uncharacterized protein YjbI with pentapeptide repeats
MTGGGRVSLWQAVTAVTATAVVFVGGLIIAGLWWFGIGTRVHGSSDTAAVEIIQLSFAFVAGIGGCVGLTVAYRRHLLDERAESREDSAQRREQSAHFTERFGAALTQLGSERFAVKLGGVYAMAALADAWEEGRQQCINVLCANVRRGYMPEPAAEAENREVTAEGFAARLAWKDNQEFRHTIIRVVGEHLRASADDPYSWQGCDFDFSGAVFDGGDLSGARFSGGIANFTGARFSGGTVDFSRAEFSGGTVDFGWAEFSGGTVNFNMARFSGSTVNFPMARFSRSRVYFTEAEFSGGTVNFNMARFSGSTVSFIMARFSGSKVIFFCARFSGGAVNFLSATFSGSTVNFAVTAFYGGTANFKKATFPSGTVYFHDAHGTLPSFDASQLASKVVVLPVTPSPSS